MQNQSSTNKLFFVLAVVLAVAAVATAIPYPGAGEKCVLGYKSFCSFNPVSTLMLGFASRTLFTLRKRNMARAKS